MLPSPYVAPDEFRAHPTYLDLDDLRSGSSSAADQEAELNNVLLTASSWADGYCNGTADHTLAAQAVRQRTRGRYDRNGLLKIHPDRGPVRSVSSLGWGLTPTALTTAAAPDYWDENDGRTLVFPQAAGGAGAWSGALQFNTVRPGGEVFLQIDYVAGWVATQLGAPAAPGDRSLTVADATGVQPGETYRLWTPGAEEFVTVSAAYTPPAPVFPAVSQPATVPLAGPLAGTHPAGVSFSGMSSDMRLAVIQYATALLLRPDTTSEDSFPDTPYSSNTRRNEPRRDGSGLVKEAERLLNGYRRVR